MGDLYAQIVALDVMEDRLRTLMANYGLDDITDLPSEHMDYSAAMTAAQSNGIGWLWWDWYNPYGSANSLSTDGTVNHLTSVGSTVVNTHPASIAHTSVKACRPM